MAVLSVAVSGVVDICTGFLQSSTIPWIPTVSCCGWPHSVHIPPKILKKYFEETDISFRFSIGERGQNLKIQVLMIEKI